MDREIENVQWDGVFYENFQSGYLAAERLIERGNKKIGIITGDMDLKHARERFQGIQTGSGGSSAAGKSCLRI